MRQIPFVSVLGATAIVALYWALGAPAARPRVRRLLIAAAVVTVTAVGPATWLASRIMPLCL
jgi:hypothetical protein